MDALTTCQLETTVIFGSQNNILKIELGVEKKSLTKRVDWSLEAVDMLLSVFHRLSRVSQEKSVQRGVAAVARETAFHCSNTDKE